jgi:AsmA-like C-terminal region
MIFPPSSGQSSLPPSNADNPKQPTTRPTHRLRWILLALVLLVGAGGIFVTYCIFHALPILRARVIETLSARFKSRIELPDFGVSMTHGLVVEGTNLKIFSETESRAGTPEQPMISVQEFSFQTGLRSLFRTPMHVDEVHIRGMVVDIPHSHKPQAVTGVPQAKGKTVLEKAKARWSEQFSIVVDRLVFDDAQVVIKTHTAGKPPTVLQITKLTMKNVGPGQPMPFQATLINPRPVGNIESQGLFGPFDEAEPRDTPVSGEYSFTHADLGTFRGISGILSSAGNYQGTLGRIEVEGATDTPDFRLATSGHPINLKTDFHAIVDGTDGDTYLQPVVAKFLHSSFTANGKVIRTAEPHGHDLEVNVVIEHARIEDLLQLAVKTDPPVISGPVVMHTRLSLPPGPEPVVDRLELNGTFNIRDGTFASEKIQDRINDLSLRAQGKPQLVKQEGDVAIASDLKGTFRLDNRQMTFSKLEFSVPGVRSDVHGQYSLDGKVFDFHGTLKLQAKLSQLTTGWKSMLLKPVDPFFSKDGAGTEIPFRVTGTRSEPHFGLDFRDKSAKQSDEVPARH